MLSQNSIALFLHVTHTFLPFPSPLLYTFSSLPSHLLSLSVVSDSCLSSVTPFVFVCATQHPSIDAPSSCKINVVLQRYLSVLVCHFDHIVAEINECREFAGASSRYLCFTIPLPAGLPLMDRTSLVPSEGWPVTQEDRC